MTASAFIAGVAGTRSRTMSAISARRAAVGPHPFQSATSNPDAVRRLVEEFRGVVGREAPVLIDQEGGRVQRLGPPHWPSYPPGAAYGRLYDEDRTRAWRRRGSAPA